MPRYTVAKCPIVLLVVAKSSFATQSVAEAIGTQSVKVLLVRMCLCLVGTHESMFSCMNMSVFYWCVCVFVGLVQTSLCLVLRTYLCSVVSTFKCLRVRVCTFGVGTYESMFSCKNMFVLYERMCWYVCLSVWLVHKPMLVV